jgi:hypothetical protein
MARIDEIGSHGRTHIAEADETDGRHENLAMCDRSPVNPGRVGCNKRSALHRFQGQMAQCAALIAPYRCPRLDAL